MEKARMLSEIISDNYGSVATFCFRHDFDPKEVNYLIGADRVKKEIKEKIFAKAKIKDEDCITEAERMEWLKAIESIGGFRQASRLTDEPAYYLRACVYGKKFKDVRFENALKKIYDLSIQ